MNPFSKDYKPTLAAKDFQTHKMSRPPTAGAHIVLPGSNPSRHVQGLGIPTMNMHPVGNGT
jgi:hypothetical protein